MYPLDFVLWRPVVALAKRSFGLVVGKYRLRLADEEVQADRFGNTLKKFGYGDKWNSRKASKGDDIKGGF